MSKKREFSHDIILYQQNLSAFRNYVYTYNVKLSDFNPSFDGELFIHFTYIPYVEHPSILIKKHENLK